MKIEVSVKLDMNVKEVTKEVIDASRLGLRDTIVSIAGDAIQGSPVRTGNNRRSIAAEVAGMGKVSGEGSAEGTVRDELEGAVYSTSGYGGFLETGTVKMSAKPYFRPALDKNKDNLIPNIKRYLK